MRKVDEVIERLRNRPHDAPMESEYLMDDAADLLSSMKAALEGLLSERCGPEDYRRARNALNGETDG
jgi:hypothetical protein